MFHHLFPESHGEMDIYGAPHAVLFATDLLRVCGRIGNDEPEAFVIMMRWSVNDPWVEAESLRVWQAAKLAGVIAMFIGVHKS